MWTNSLPPAVERTPGPCRAVRYRYLGIDSRSTACLRARSGHVSAALAQANLGRQLYWSLSFRASQSCGLVLAVVGPSVSGLAGGEVLGQRGVSELLAHQPGQEQQRGAWPVVCHNVLGLPDSVAGDQDDTADRLTRT